MPVLRYFRECGTRNPRWNRSDFERMHPALNFEAEIQKLAETDKTLPKNIKRHAVYYYDKIQAHRARLEAQAHREQLRRTNAAAGAAQSAITIGEVVVQNGSLNINPINPNHYSASSPPIDEVRPREVSPPPQKPAVYNITLPQQKIRLSAESLDDETQLTLSRGFLLLSNIKVEKALGESFTSVLEAIPKLPFVPPFFHKALEACTSIRETPFVFPQPPEGYLDDENKYLWKWMYHACSQLYTFWDVIGARSLVNGEVYIELHMWGPLLDAVFLGSATVDCDRKEIGAGVHEVKLKHDGVVRGLARPVVLGVIEIKPPRSAKPSAARTRGYAGNDDYPYDDHSKLAYTMARLLRHHGDPELTLTGIVCEAYKMTVYRGKLLGDVCVFKEVPIPVHLDGLATVLEACWRFKLGCEEAYAQLVATKRTQAYEAL